MSTSTLLLLYQYHDTKNFLENIRKNYLIASSFLWTLYFPITVTFCVVLWKKAIERHSANWLCCYSFTPSFPSLLYLNILFFPSLPFNSSSQHQLSLLHTPLTFFVSACFDLHPFRPIYQHWITTNSDATMEGLTPSEQRIFTLGMLCATDGFSNIKVSLSFI